MNHLPNRGLTILTIMAGLLTSITTVMIILAGPSNPDPVKKKKEYYETGVDRQLSMFFQSRSYPDPTHLNEKFAAAWDHARSIRAAQNSHPISSERLNLGGWTSLNGPRVGRVLSIAIHPTTTTTLFIGTASGGIFKTVNSGTNWTFVPTNLPVLGVPTITFHPTNGNILLAGTGEVYRVDTSNIGYNIWKARGTYGAGIIRSTDGGVTWTQVLNKNMSELFGVQMIRFDPTNSNIVYAATTHGLFKSTDAGATWGASPILNKIYVSDVIVNSLNNLQMLAAVGNLVNSDKGIYRSLDGGLNWIKITSGLPASFSGFSRFTYLSGNTAYIAMGRDDAGENELFRTTDFGLNWTSLNNSHHCQFQFWFANTAAIIPSRPDTLWMGGVSFYRYRVSTQARTTIGGTMHSDHHDIKFDPTNNAIAYVANDGGMYRSANALNGTPTFTEINNGLTISQFYASFGVSKTVANRYVGGLQDNGVWSWDGTSWLNEFGGDGGPSAVDPTNASIAFASNDARSVRKSTTGVMGTYNSVLGSWAFTGDDRTGFMAPIAIAPSSPSTVYVASDNFHKTTNGGTSWTNNNATISANTDYIEALYKTGIAIAVSHQNADRVFVSLSNFSQNVNNSLNVVGQPNLMRSLNGGTTKESIKGNLPDRFVLDILVSETNDDSVFVTLGGYGGPHVYVTGNAKAVPASNVTWTPMGVGLIPDVPYNAICFDRVNKNIIYAGSDLGVYVSPDRGFTWYDFNTGMADTDPVMIYDLQYSADNKIVAATHGRGVFQTEPFDPNTLPVTIRSITGIHDRGYNKISWKVEQESAIRHYELERLGPDNQYHKIGTVTARNQLGEYTYSLSDAASSYITANYYYRVKIVEMDGSFRYSSVVQVQVKAKNGFQVITNPFTDQIRMNIALGSVSQMTISLYNMQGALVHRQQLKVDAGNRNYSINGLQQLSSGIYVLEAIHGRERYSFKVMKK